MARKRNKRTTAKRNQVLSSEANVEEEGNFRTYAKDLKQVVFIEDATGRNIYEILTEFGSMNFNYKDIAILLRIPTTRFTKMMAQGQEDYENKVVSHEAKMYVAYYYGLKSLEGTAVRNLAYKAPEKLLPFVNPHTYSDKVIDKYELPKIVINVGDKPIEIEEEKGE